MTQGISSFCIVADDLSGAADCAAAFARTAGPVPVYLGAVPPHDACFAADSDSRAMDAGHATEVTTRVFGRLARFCGADQLVYKKIDSTLRGHVGIELAAALQAAPQFDAALVAPAFPAQGRTLVGGRLLVHGRPAEQLGSAADLMDLLDAAGLRPALLKARRSEEAAELAQRIRAALEHGALAIVADAAEQEDLDRLALALRAREAPRLLVAGSAGLARSLAMHVTPGATVAPVSRWRGPVLALVGSFSDAAVAQVDQVQACGAAHVIRLSPLQWQDAQHAELRRSALESARLALCSGHNVLFASSGRVLQPFSPALVQAMAAATARLLDHAGGCVLTGGDTARAMFSAAGIARLDVCGEFEPGISIGRAASRPQTEFILKAGGFGDAYALQRIIRQFGAPSVPST